MDVKKQIKHVGTTIPYEQWRRLIYTCVIKHTKIAHVIRKAIEKFVSDNEKEVERYEKNQ